MNPVVPPVPPVPEAPRFGPEQLGRRCLVTGGAGYVGRALVRRLAASGVPVRSLDLAPHRHGAGVEVLAGDLRDAGAVTAACAGVDTVFHTAALINLLTLCRPSVRRRVYDVNVAATRQLLDAATAAGATAFVYTSSFNVALNGAAPVQDESLPYADHARDLYSRTKIAAERAVLAADRAGGLRTCALRPGGIWGCDTESLMLSRFVSQLAAGRFTALVGRRGALLDNSHVENLVDAQLLAATALRARPAVAGGRAYNITDGEPVNGMEWFRPLVEGLGRRFPEAWLPVWLQQALAVLMEGAHWLGAPEPLLTLRGIGNLVEGSNLCIDRARRDLGYAPRYSRANAMPMLLAAARARFPALREAPA